MKKFLTLTIALIICVSACIGVSASEITNNIICIGETEVIFDETCTLSSETKQQVAEYFVNGNPNVSTYGLMCTLFGHDFDSVGATTVTHCARDSAPRCLQEEWEIEICTRCDYMDPVRVAFFYIYCCD